MLRLLKKMRCKNSGQISEPPSSGFSLFATIFLVSIGSCQLEVLSQLRHPVQNLILRWTERNSMKKIKEK